MSKKQDLIEQLKPLTRSREKLKGFIEDNSNLPGPRGNIELAFALAEIYEDQEVLIEWTDIDEKQAGVNNPKSFPAFCAAVCLGKLYLKNRDKTIVSVLKKLANDGRWRMREAVAFAFQLIGESDFIVLKNIFSEWIKSANYLEKRAILVSLAHPPLLNRENAEYCLKISDSVLKDLNKETAGFEVLKKGLDFTISVFAASIPSKGLDFINKWIGKDKVINRIMKANLKKKRISSKKPGEVKALLNRLEFY